MRNLVLIFLLVGLLALSPSARADTAVAQVMSREGKTVVVVTIDDKPCALDAVKNLPSHSTWKEVGKQEIEGCWGLSLSGVVVIYYADKTIATIPARDFVVLPGV